MDAFDAYQSPDHLSRVDGYERERDPYRERRRSPSIFARFSIAFFSMCLLESQTRTDALVTLAVTDLDPQHR